MIKVKSKIEKIYANFNKSKYTMFKKNMRIKLLILLIIVGMSISPRFASPANIRNILFRVSLVGFLALGQTLLMIVREIDLSIGSLMAFAPIAAVVILEKFLGSAMVEPGNMVVDGTNLILLVTLLFGMLVGAVIGLIRINLKVPSLIITLGLLYSFRGGSYVLSGGHPYYMTMLEGFAWLGEADVLFFPVSFILWFVTSLIVLIVLKYTRAGNALYAIGGNETAAKYSNIDVKKWKLSLFMLCSFFASISALIYSSRLGSIEAAQGSGYELTSVAVAIIGGATIRGGEGSIKGMIIGALIFGVVLNLISIIGFVDWYNDVLFGIVIIGSAFIYRTTR